MQRQRSAKSSYSNLNNSNNSSFKKQKQKQDPNNNFNNVNTSNTSQKKEKNIFYTQLKIQTHDKTVPLVRILKVQQELQNKFVHYFAYLQNLMSNIQIRSKRRGFNQILKNSTTIQKYKSTLNTLMNILLLQQKKRKHFSFIKIQNNLLKFRKKQISVTLMKRFCSTIFNNYFRLFFRNYSQKGLLSIVWEKTQQDEVVKLKMDIQILKRLVYSKQFINICKVFQKIVKGSMLQNQLNKNILQNSINTQLQRFQGIRQNQNQKNRQKTLFDNEIVLIALKNHGMAIKDLRDQFNRHILSLQEQIQNLKSNQLIVSIRTQLNQYMTLTKSFQALANEFYRADQQLRKIPQNNHSKLISVLTSQQTKFQKLFQKSSKSDVTHSKFYQSRTYLISIALKLQNRETFEQAYTHFVSQVTKIVNFYKNSHQLTILVQKYKKDNYQQVLSHLVSCLLQFHAQKEKLQQSLKELREEKGKISKQLQQSISKSKQKQKLIERKKQPEKQKPKPITTPTTNIPQKSIQTQENILWSQINSGIIEFIKFSIQQFNKGKSISANKFLKLKKYSERTVELNNYIMNLVQALNVTLSNLQIASKNNEIGKIIQLVRCFHLCWLQQAQYKKQWLELCKNLKKQQSYNHTIKVLEEILQENKILKEKLKDANKQPIQQKQKIEDKSKQNQAFAKLLHEKMQIQKAYSQLQNKLFIKTEQLKISTQKEKHQQKKVKQLEDTLKKQLKIKNTLQSQIQTLNLNHNSYLQEIQIYKVNISTELQENSKLKKQISKLKAQLNLYQKKKQQNKSKESKSHNLHVKEEEILKQNQELLIRQQFLSQEIITYKNKFQTISQSFNENRTAVLDYKHQLTEKNHQIQMLSSELQQLKIHLNAINSFQVNYKKEIQDLKQRIHELKISNSEINKVKSQDSQSQIYKFENARLKAQNQRLSYNVNRLNIYLQQINSQKDNLWRQNSQNLNKLNEKDEIIDRMINDSKITISTLNMKLVQIQKLSKEDLQRMQDRLAQKQKIIMRLEAQMNQMSRKYSHLQIGQINQNTQTKILTNLQFQQSHSTISGSLIQQKQIQLLQEQIKSLQNYIIILQDQILKEKQKSNTAIKNYYDILSNKHNEKLNNNLSNNNNNNNEITSNLQLENSVLQKEVSSLKQELHKLYQILQQKTNLISDGQSLNRQQAEKLSIQQTKIKNSQLMIQQLKRELQHLKASSEIEPYNDERAINVDLNGLKDSYLKLRSEYQIKNKQIQKNFFEKNKILVQNQNRMKNTIFSQQKEVLELNAKIQSLKKELQLYRVAKSQQQLETLSVLSSLQSTYMQIESKISQLTSENSNKERENSILALLKEIKSMLTDNQRFSQNVKLFYGHKKPNHADMDYVKQLIYSILKAFGEFSSQSQLASNILLELNGMTSTNATIEEAFIAMEEYAINYLKDTLSTYKKELRVKAIQLQEVKLRLQQMINQQLRHENYLQNKFNGQNEWNTADTRFGFTPNITIKNGIQSHIHNQPIMKFQTSYVQRFNNTQQDFRSKR